MIKDRWSPYLTAMDGTQKIHKPSRSDVYAISKERKNITEQLQLMKIRIKQLEKEEQRAKLKAINASALSESIIERRVEKKQKEDFMDKVKKLRAQEMQDLKERNREMKEEIKTSIAMKKEALQESKKLAAKAIKEMQSQRKAERSTVKYIKSASASPRPSNLTSKVENLKLTTFSKAEEEKERANEALSEIKKLEELERVLIEKLREAYEKQKSEENKVAFLINHPVIASKQELNKLSSQDISNSSNL